jgi:hypothetical protein
MDKAAVDRWLRAYIDAWKSYDRDQIAALFAEGVRYRYHPYDEPIEGRDAVVASWLGESDAPGASTRDEPGTYEAEYRTVAVDGDVAPRDARRPCRAHLRQLLRDGLRRGWPLHGVHRVVHRASSYLSGVVRSPAPGRPVRAARAPGVRPASPTAAPPDPSRDLPPARQDRPAAAVAREPPEEPGAVSDRGRRRSGARCRPCRRSIPIRFGSNRSD